MRNWSDEQDALGYEHFVGLADDHGIEKATDKMREIMRMGADFAEIDVQGWVGKYMDEEFPARQEREADEFVFRNSTI